MVQTRVATRSAIHRRPACRWGQIRQPGLTRGTTVPKVYGPAEHLIRNGAGHCPPQACIHERMASWGLSPMLTEPLRSVAGRIRLTGAGAECMYCSSSRPLIRKRCLASRLDQDLAETQALVGRIRSGPVLRLLARALFLSPFSPLRQGGPAWGCASSAPLSPSCGGRPKAAFSTWASGRHPEALSGNPPKQRLPREAYCSEDGRPTTLDWESLASSAACLRQGAPSVRALGGASRDRAANRPRFEAQAARADGGALVQDAGCALFCAGFFRTRSEPEWSDGVMRGGGLSIERLDGGVQCTAGPGRTVVATHSAAHQIIGHEAVAKRRVPGSLELIGNSPVLMAVDRPCSSPRRSKSARVDIALEGRLVQKDDEGAETPQQARTAKTQGWRPHVGERRVGRCGTEHDRSCCRRGNVAPGRRGPRLVQYARADIHQLSPATHAEAGRCMIATKAFHEHDGRMRSHLPCWEKAHNDAPFRK